MTVLITSAASDAGQQLAAALAPAHTVRLTDQPGRSSGNIVACDLGHDDGTDALFDGVDVIVHLGDRSEGLTDGEVVDAYSRKTYNLMTAASAAGVGHVVHVSSLQLFAASDPDYEIDEQWAPPVTTDVETLRHHIGEFVVREFARAHAFPVTCLRFGRVVSDDQVEADCVSQSHFAQAVASAIEKRPAGWAVFHVVSDGAHFKTKRAAEGLGLELQLGEGA